LKWVALSNKKNAAELSVWLKQTILAHRLYYICTFVHILNVAADQKVAEEVVNKS